MQLFSADATMFFFLISFHFCPQKTPSKVAQKYSNFIFHPGLPKRPKQKNSCSKILLTDQLYIKLGIH